MAITSAPKYLVCVQSTARFLAEAKCGDASDVFLHKLWSFRTCAVIHMHSSYSLAPEGQGLIKCTHTNELV